MQKIQKPVSTLVFLVMLGATGCARLNRKDFPDGHISGVEYLIRTTPPHKLEEQVLYGERYYFQETEERDNTLPFLIYPFDKVQRVFDLDSKKMTLEAKEEYIPVRVEVATGTKDKWADKIVLRASDSKLTGVKGIKADIISAEELRKIAGTSKDDYGYKVITTEDGAQFAIKTIKKNNREYFFPHVSDEKTFEIGKLPFYLIPVKGAKILIDNLCGNVTIINENNIFRPHLITEETRSPIRLEITPGQESSGIATHLSAA
jgi:hypothetical protein